MKKLFRTMLCAALATAALCVSAFAADTVPAKQGDFYVEVNGEYVTFTDAVPKIKNDRSCLPFVAVFEQLGFAEKDMTWNGDTSTVTATKGDTTISLTIGKKQITLTQAGKTTVIDTDVAPYIEPALSRTYVPFGLVADALGYNVGWDAGQGTVIIDDVDAILAANKETYALMDKLSTYTNSFAGKNQKVTGSYGASLDLVAADASADDGYNSIGMWLDGVYDMVTAGGSKLQFTTTIEADAVTDEDTEDEDSIVLNMELRSDLEKGAMYIKSPELAAMMGQEGMASAWLKMDMKSMMDEAGLNYADLMKEALAAKGQTFSQQLPEVLKSLPLNDASMTTKDTLALLNALCADSSFQKSGNTYYNTIELEDAGTVSLALDTKGNKVVGYSFDFVLTVDEVEISMEVYMEDQEMSAGLSFNVLDENNYVLIVMYLNGTYSSTNSQPATEPPAGAAVVDLMNLIGG